MPFGLHGSRGPPGPVVETMRRCPHRKYTSRTEAQLLLVFAILGHQRGENMASEAWFESQATVERARAWQVFLFTKIQIASCRRWPCVRE
jgi:hypothetical protein